PAPTPHTKAIPRTNPNSHSTASESVPPNSAPSAQGHCARSPHLSRAIASAPTLPSPHVGDTASASSIDSPHTLAHLERLGNETAVRARTHAAIPREITGHWEGHTRSSQDQL